MPINGRRIDQLTATSGAVLQASDVIHVIDSVAGGYTNKKISVSELRNYVAAELDVDIEYLSGEVSGNNTDIAAISSNYVTTDTVQSITGHKTFTNVTVDGLVYGGDETGDSLELRATSFENLPTGGGPPLTYLKLNNGSILNSVFNGSATAYVNNNGGGITLNALGEYSNNGRLYCSTGGLYMYHISSILDPSGDNDKIGLDFEFGRFNFYSVQGSGDTPTADALSGSSRGIYTVAPLFIKGGIYGGTQSSSVLTLKAQGDEKTDPSVDALGADTSINLTTLTTNIRYDDPIGYVENAVEITSNGVDIRRKSQSSLTQNIEILLEEDSITEILENSNYGSIPGIRTVMDLSGGNYNISKGESQSSLSTVYNLDIYNGSLELSGDLKVTDSLLVSNNGEPAWDYHMVDFIKDGQVGKESALGFWSYNDNNLGPYFEFFYGGGTKDSPTKVLNGDVLHAQWVYGYNQSTQINFAGGIEYMATEDYNTTYGTKMDFYSVNTGNTNSVKSFTMHGDIIYSRNFVPFATNTYSLGTSALSWKDLYITGNISLSGNIVSKLDTIDPTPASVEIDFDGTGAYEYNLSGTTAFTVINATSVTVKSAVSLLSSSAATDISATFDPTWYWVGTRPTDDLITITSGAMVELVVRSSGTKIIAAYEDIV